MRGVAKGVRWYRIFDPNLTLSRVAVDLDIPTQKVGVVIGQGDRKMRELVPIAAHVLGRGQLAKMPAPERAEVEPAMWMWLAEQVVRHRRGHPIKADPQADQWIISMVKMVAATMDIEEENAGG